MRNHRISVTSISLLTAVFLIAASVAFAQEANGTTQKNSATNSTENSKQVAKADADKTVTPTTTVEATVPSTTAVPEVTQPIPAKTNVTSAVPPQSTGSDEWRVEIRPYLWLAGMTGDLRVRNRTTHVSASAGDLLGMLDFAIAGQLEAGKGKWRLVLDEDYINLGTTVTTTGPLGFQTFTTNVQPTMNIFEFGGAYALVHKANKSGDAALPPALAFEIIGGGRYTHMGLGLEPSNAAAVEGSRNIVDAFIGNRFKVGLSPKVSLIAKYTVGGGGSHFAWTAGGYVDFIFHKNLSLTGGYQVLGMDADQASNAVGFDGRLRGLFLGLTIYR